MPPKAMDLPYRSLDLALMEKWKQAGQGGGNFRGKGWRELAHMLGPPPGGSLDRTRWSDLNPLAQKVRGLTKWSQRLQGTQEPNVAVL